MKVYAIIGLVLGACTVGIAFISGLEYDWSLIGLAAGVGIILNSVALLQINGKSK